MADTQLEADRLAARKRAQPGDECHPFQRCAESGMLRWRNTVDSQRHAARFGNLPGDLSCGQDAAMARLGALAQLDLDHFDLRTSRLRGELIRVEVGIGGA